MCRFIFITGGVLSGLGKGIVASSLANILKARGLKVNIQKFDQYLNVDAGTLNPAEHGEVFVTKDGAETDLDLGHYERFTDQELTASSSVMTGDIYLSVINKERRGDYLGKTVQVIPHLTQEVKERVISAAQEAKADIHIAEIGGTVGDYEGAHFLEGMRQLKTDIGEDRVCFVHVVFLPYLKASDEVKSKPAQNSVRDLRGIGIQPDVIVARSDYPISDSVIDKLSLFCDIPKEAIIPLETASTVYEVPLTLENYNLGEYLIKRLKIKCGPPDLGEWQALVARIKSDKRKIPIALVGKYMAMDDTYISITEAIKAAAWALNFDANIRWVDSTDLEKDDDLTLLEGIAGIVVPGGFGSRGIEGKIKAARFAREKRIPYFGLCLGMQVAVIEFARNVLGMISANSTEFDEKTKFPVIHIMPEQEKIIQKGGTMRLGAWPCVLDKNSKSFKAYGVQKIFERHRHRYEFNNKYRKQMEKAGLRLAGLSPDKKLVEIIEVEDHPWFVGVQFHPEFKSRPTKPHPLFFDFIRACIETSTLGV